eukprot:gb/GECH01014915.1/.p1 GENE.gb/GECH01014915.1/~~gb/GECH01014915.1/.p1  ORF type:complete len:314 (+),score=42.38 gb/GECH01014915.1/:1-942(+)
MLQKLFGPSCHISVEFSDADSRSLIDIPSQRAVRWEEIQGEDGRVPKGTEVAYMFGDEDTVAGEVALRTAPGKKIEHRGIDIRFVGQIIIKYDGNEQYEFTSLVKELRSPGIVSGETRLPFEFSGLEKQYESYHGRNARLRYMLLVTVHRGYGNLVHEEEMWVHKVCTQPPEINTGIKMEVGIDECLQIEFEYDKSKYHLSDVVLGKIYFQLVRVKIKYMELALIQRESTGAGVNVYNDSKIVNKFEIMDGCPTDGESIPVRMFLGGSNLTPTYKRVNNKFSVKYYLNLVLVDEDDRKYYKQHEIVLWRDAAE